MLRDDQKRKKGLELEPLDVKAMKNNNNDHVYVFVLKALSLVKLTRWCFPEDQRGPKDQLPSLEVIFPHRTPSSISIHNNTIVLFCCSQNMRNRTRCAEKKRVDCLSSPCKSSRAWSKLQYDGTGERKKKRERTRSDCTEEAKRGEMSIKATVYNRIRKERINRIRAVAMSCFLSLSPHRICKRRNQPSISLVVEATVI